MIPKGGGAFRVLILTSCSAIPAVPALRKLGGVLPGPPPCSKSTSTARIWRTQRLFSFGTPKIRTSIIKCGKPRIWTASYASAAETPASLPTRSVKTASPLATTLVSGPVVRSALRGGKYASLAGSEPSGLGRASSKEAMRAKHFKNARVSNCAIDLTELLKSAKDYKRAQNATRPQWS